MFRSHNETELYTLELEGAKLPLCEVAVQQLLTARERYIVSQQYLHNWLQSKCFLFSLAHIKIQRNVYFK